MKKELRLAAGNGSLSGLLGSLCCVAPLVLLLLGLSGVSGALALIGVLQQYTWRFFVPLAAVFLAGAIYFHIRHREGTCTFREIKRYKKYVAVTVSFAVIVWVLLLYVIVPVAFNMLS